MGERLHTAEGAVTVEALEKVRGVHRVYNLEVEGDHEYLVGEAGVRAHNAGCGGGKGLGGNPFKGKTPEQIDKMFKDKGFELKGPDPMRGKGSYINPKTGRKYYLDKGGVYKKGTEYPHVDVHRPAASPLPKRKYPLGEKLNSNE